MALPKPRVRLRPPGAPVLADRDRTVAPLRSAREGTPVAGEWRRRFPFGVFIDQGVINTAALVRAMYTDQTTGLIATNLRDVITTNGQPYSHDQVQGISALIGTLTAGGDATIVVSPFGRTHATDNDTGLYSTEWYLTAYSAGFHTDARADGLADRILDPPFNYDTLPAVLGYNLRDDTTHTGSIATMVGTMARAFKRRDSYDRAVMGVLGTQAGAAEVADDVDIALFSIYPCGRYLSDIETAEGDFHRATFAGFSDLGGGGGDWVDALRHFVDDIPGKRIWMAMQAHQTISGGAGTRLRYPTAREVRAMTWILVGEGVTGMYAFTWNDQPGNWDGLQHASRADVLQAYAEMSRRLTPAIRQRLIVATRITNAFTAAGGGSAGYPVNYPNAYVSTLYDAASTTHYCVACNRSTSAANVTISSGSLTGRLVDLETGEEVKLGTATAFPALDGRIFRLDPDRGVPRWRRAANGEGVEAFWADHWVNPASPNYRATGAVTTHPTIVNVGGADSLSAAVAAYAQDNVTFRLAAGYVQPAGETVTVYRRNGLHIVAADPGNRPTVRRFELFGSTHADQYNGSTTPKAGFVHKLDNFAHANHDEALYDFFVDPMHDVLFRDLDFRGDGQLIDYEWYFIDNIWQHDHRVTGTPIFMRSIRDVLVENCTFERYVWGSQPPQPPPVTEPNATDPPNTRHDGFVHGNAGIENVVVRDCTMRVTDAAGVTDTTRGFPYAIFFDGPRGVVLSGNTITAGRYNSGTILFLDNNDFTGDYDGAGQVRTEHERNAKFCIVHDNDLHEGGNGPIQWTGRDCLIVGNRVNLPSAGFTLSRVCQISPRCSKLWPRGHVYEHYGNVIDGNDIPQGNVTAFVEYISGDANNCIGSGFDASVWGRIGRSTVKNNHVKGTITSWIRDKPDEDVPSDGGDIVTGNTTG